jgi:hypothetical protein
MSQLALGDQPSHAQLGCVIYYLVRWLRKKCRRRCAWKKKV